MKKRLWTFLLVIFLTPTQASMQDYTAAYQLFWHGLSVGNSRHSVKKIGPNRYQASAQSYPKLRFLPYNDFEYSEFTLDNKQARPERYNFRTQENRKKREGQLIFDWDKKQVIKILKNTAPCSEPLPALAQDKITHFFQLREDLKAGKKELHYTIIEPNKIKHWNIRILGQERLKTPLGILTTLKLEHISDNQERRTQFWVAKDLDYLMVKLIQFRKGRKTAEVFIEKFVPN